MQKAKYHWAANPPRERGFTLIELMVVLALIGVMLTIAIPNFRSFILNSRVTSSANAFLSALSSARTEAIKRQQSVAVCATSDSTAASPTCSGSWTQGASSAWIMWVDFDNDWVPDNNANEPVVARGQALDSSLFLLSNNSGRVKYLFSGFAAPPSGGFTNTSSIAICDSRGTKTTTGADSAGRAVFVSPTGRARVTRVKSEIDAITGIGAVCAP